jgi:hypothetical protein
VKKSLIGIIIAVIVIGVFLLALTNPNLRENKETWFGFINVNPDRMIQSINNFEECIADGNPAMESYPRQCRTIDGQHFVETIDEPSCDPSYPDICITPYPIDLDCDEISHSNFRVIGNDPHGFDADNDGIGCES